MAKFESLQTLLTLAVQDGLRVLHRDLTTAFLNRELKEEVYMDQSEEPKCKARKTECANSTPVSMALNKLQDVEMSLLMKG